jgi:hypothetical protein
LVLPIRLLSAAGRVFPYPRASAFPARGYAVDGDHIYYGSVDYDPSTGSYGGSALARVTPLPPVFDYPARRRPRRRRTWFASEPAPLTIPRAKESVNGRGRWTISSLIPSGS